MSASERNDFVHAVLDLYLGLPHSAARRPSRNDRHLAGQLFDRGIVLPLIRAAMLLAMARRSQRAPDAPPLTPIRSLYYFTPVIDELLISPDPAYIDHINERFHHLFSRPNGHFSTFPDGH